METIERKEKTFEQLMCETKMNLLGIQYLNKIEEEIKKVGDCSCCGSEYNFLECNAYINGLRDAIKFFKELKNQQ